MKPWHYIDGPWYGPSPVTLLPWIPVNTTYYSTSCQSLFASRTCKIGIGKKYCTNFISSRDTARSFHGHDDWELGSGVPKCPDYPQSCSATSFEQTKHWSVARIREYVMYTMSSKKCYWMEEREHLQHLLSAEPKVEHYRANAECERCARHQALPVKHNQLCLQASHQELTYNVPTSVSAYSHI